MKGVITIDLKEIEAFANCVECERTVQGAIQVWLETDPETSKIFLMVGISEAIENQKDKNRHLHRLRAIPFETLFSMPVDNYT